jgi:hypothetical protein
MGHNRRGRPLVSESWSSGLTTPPAGSSASVRLRYERMMTLSVRDGTAPTLLDRDDVATILEVAPGVLDRWVREGRLVDQVMVGNRQLFRSSDVRCLAARAA